MNIKKHNISETEIPQWENGRVTNLSNRSFQPLPMTIDPQNNDNSFQHQALKGIQEETKLSALFFSNVNMKIIQDRIRYDIWVRTNKIHIIAPQNIIELEIIMRGIYLQYALNLNCKFRDQINRLNQLVIDWCVPKIFVEVEQHFAYLDRIQTLPVPIDLPQNLSSSGTKMLRSITSTF